MLSIEFVGQSVRDADHVAANSGRIINMYREPVGQGGRTPFVLKSVPALNRLGQVDQVFARAIERVREQMFAVVGGRLYEINEDGSSVELGEVGDSVATTIAGNSTPTQTRFGVASAGDYFYWDGSTLTSPDTGAFDAIGSVTSGAQYNVLTELDGSRFQWTRPGIPDELDGLDFATAESRDDKIIRGQFINGNLWLFGARSIEPWQVTGLEGARAFQRIGGSTIGAGLKAFNLLCAFDSGAFFIGNDGSAYITSGGDMSKITTPPVHVAIQEGEPTRCTYYEHEGHKFCVIIFADRPAWVYDITTREWHERSSGVGHDAWGIAQMVRGSDGFFAIDDLGNFSRVQKMGPDATELVRRTAVSRTLTFDGARKLLAELEIFGRTGFAALDGRAVSVNVSLSKDHGVTWGTARTLSMADVGNYGMRQVLRSLGQFRQVTMRIDITDAANVSMDASCRVRIV